MRSVGGAWYRLLSLCLFQNYFSDPGYVPDTALGAGDKQRIDKNP